MRIMSSIQDYGRRAAYQLEPAWKVHLREPLTDHVRMQRLESKESFGRSERLSSIGGLMRAVERQENVVDRTIGGAEPDELPGHGELAVDYAEVDALALRKCTDLGAAGKQDLRGFDALASQDGVCSRLNDSGLLPRDFADGTAQQVCVIKIDWGHDCDLGIGHIGSVPGTTQAHFNDRDINRRIGECCVRHGCDDLEEGHRYAVDLAFIDERHIRRDLPPHLVEALVADGLTVDSDPLGNAHHMWAGESTRAQAIGAQQ